MFSNKITQAMYSVLGNKLKKSTVTNEEYRIQGDESEIDGRHSNQGNKDIRNNDIIKVNQNEVDRNSEEKLNQEEDETTSDNSDDKKLKVSLVKLIIR